MSIPDDVSLTVLPRVLTRRLRGFGPFVVLSALWLLSAFSAVWFDGLLAWTAGLLYVGYDTFLIGFVAWQTRQLRPAPRTFFDTELALGIVVPARNEAGVLAATLDPLLAQLRPQDRLLMVDDGSVDATRAVLAARYGVTAPAAQGLVTSSVHTNLSVLFKTSGGKADALNAGWHRLTTPVIVTIDADTRIAAGALDAFRKAFAAEPDLAAACGILRPTGVGGLQARAFQLFQHFEYLRAFLSRAAWMRCGSLLLVSGAFAAYRRGVLERIGGFDPDCLVEDYEITHRLHRYSHEHALHWTVRVLPEPRSETDAPAEIMGFLRQRRRWFAGFLQTQFAYRELHGDARYGNVGRLMLPIKALDTVQPIFGLTAFFLLLAFIGCGGRPTAAVLSVLAVKLAIDFSYHFWAVSLYHRWLGEPLPRGIWRLATLATLLEPFSFQLLRHLGALLGWGQIVTGRRDWAPQRRNTTHEKQYREVAL